MHVAVCEGCMLQWRIGGLCTPCFRFGPDVIPMDTTQMAQGLASPKWANILDLHGCALLKVG